MEKRPEGDWEGARRFHGHLGPWLALGMKMGSMLLRELGARPYFGLRIRVECPLAPPVSCLLDGLQWSTGATYGKQNLLAQAGEEVKVWAENTDTGEQVELVALPETPARLQGWLADLGEEGAALQVWESPAEEFFRLRRLESEDAP